MDAKRVRAAQSARYPCEHLDAFDLVERDLDQVRLLKRIRPLRHPVELRWCRRGRTFESVDTLSARR